MKMSEHRKLPIISAATNHRYCQYLDYHYHRRRNA